MALPIPDQVVVITGASSGIGRETALAFARAGAAVIGAARNEAALASLRQEARGFGGQIETVVADVSIFGDVESIAAHAIERFGRIDTWVNNAAVTVYGRLNDLEPDELARVVAVDLLGAMYGSKVALAEMSRRGAGTIINIGSVLSERGVQLQAPYVASKHGIAGFTEALRLEVRETAPEIDVVLILPSSINTPFFEHARSKLGELPAPIPPVYQPHAVAKAIVHAAEHGGRDIVVGGAGKMLVVNDRIASALMDRVMTTTGLMSRMQRARRPDDAADNLFQPSRGSGSTTGEFGDGAIATSVYTNQLELHPMRKRAALGLALIGGLWLMRRMST
jgi:short-subunit dehydrogenase